MARVETRRERDREVAPEQADDDSHLEDWFARRLESQGIPTKMPRGVNTRILAVGGFAVALLGLIWAFSVAGPGSSTSSATPTTKPSTSSTSPNSSGTPNNTNGGSKNKPKAPAWNTITVDVLNGSGISGAAAAASTTMSGAGWHTGVTGDAGTETTATTVVYAPGHKPEAQVVANEARAARSGAARLGGRRAVDGNRPVSPSCSGPTACPLSRSALPRPAARARAATRRCRSPFAPHIGRRPACARRTPSRSR